MGKRPEDLRKLDDTPIERQVEALESHHTWHGFVGAIEAMLVTGQYDWAFETLDGIRETVLKTKRVTEAQERAVGNIESGKASRRYEGYRSRWGRW